jgi:hypothetical protein
MTYARVDNKGSESIKFSANTLNKRFVSMLRQAREEQRGRHLKPMHTLQSHQHTQLFLSLLPISPTIASTLL